MATTLSILGAAETVTGSRYLVETERARVLVDCGLFQGWKRLRERNWSDPPFDPAGLDAVVLTHAHIDHSGYVPRLVALGFRGPVYCTQGTMDLLKILLPDSGHLQEEEARYANRKGYSKHRPARPLYTREEAENCLAQLIPKPFHESVEVAPEVSVRFSRAGHIIGSATVKLSAGALSLSFTGDVGRPDDPVMKPPDPLTASDYLITESTYGDRRHPEVPVDEILAKVVNEAVDRKGVVLVPAFAVGRAQHVLHLLALLKASHRIPDIPVFLDSPMAIDVTELLTNHSHDHRLDPAGCRRLSSCARYTNTPEESKALDQREGDSMVIVSASGMATGGRVLYHLKRFLPDERNTVLFTGFQAAGTRGRSLVDGTDEVKLLGRYVAVRAHVERLEGLSAHADYREMLEWFERSRISPRQVFVTHGEPHAADAFRRRIKDTMGWNAVVPTDGARFRL